MSEFLNIVDENDNIIGQEERTKIHAEGLLHREIHVFFLTPQKNIIFQHRAKDKDTFPDLLDATVGGHVEIDDSYEQTAVKETGEETGIKIENTDIIFVKKIKRNSKDEVTKKINYSWQSRYLYLYEKPLDDLTIENGKATGFEAWPIDKLLNLSDNEKTKFIPSILEFVITDLIPFINNLKL